MKEKKNLEIGIENKPFLSANECRCLYGISYNTLQKLAAVSGAKSHVGSRCFYNRRKLDSAIEAAAVKAC